MLALISTLESSVGAPTLTRVAELLVRSVESLLGDSHPDAARIRSALESGDPMGEPLIATAFAEALMELQAVLTELGVPAGKQTYRRPRTVLREVSS
jgi:hypothetical protein